MQTLRHGCSPTRLATICLHKTRTAKHKLRASSQIRFAMLHDDQALGAQHRQIGQINRAVIAQLAARGSHNPKVMSSILTRRRYLFRPAHRIRRTQVSSKQSLQPRSPPTRLTRICFRKPNRKIKKCTSGQSMLAMVHDDGFCSVAAYCNCSTHVSNTSTPKNQNIDPRQNRFESRNHRCRRFAKGRASRALEEDMLRQGAYEHVSFWHMRIKLPQGRVYQTRKPSNSFGQPCSQPGQSQIAKR